MKKVITLVAVLSLTSIGWAGTNREATNDRLDHAGHVLHEIMAAPDKCIPEEVLDAEILTYSRARGAFAGITLDGASIRRDNDSTRDIYGPHVSTRSILHGGVACRLLLNRSLKQ